MIANLNAKKCPFRKEYIMGGTETRSQFQDIVTGYVEQFQECIDKECMAWGEKERTCLLMRKEEAK